MKIVPGEPYRDPDSPDELGRARYRVPLVPQPDLAWIQRFGGALSIYEYDPARIERVDDCVEVAFGMLHGDTLKDRLDDIDFRIAVANGEPSSPHTVH